jgi:hypothetical protein
LDTISGALVPLFNPRVQSWHDHFQLDAGAILPLTSTGRATAALLKFNLPQRVEIRASLTQADRYPRRF